MQQLAQGAGLSRRTPEPKIPPRGASVGGRVRSVLSPRGGGTRNCLWSARARKTRAGAGGVARAALTKVKEISREPREMVPSLTS